MAGVGGGEGVAAEGLVDAVGEDAVDVVWAGVRVREEGGVDVVEDAHAVLQEADCRGGEQAVAHGAQGGDGVACLDRHDEVVDGLFGLWVRGVVEVEGFRLGLAVRARGAYGELDFVAGAWDAVAVGMEGDCAGALSPGLEELVAVEEEGYRGWIRDASQGVGD